MTMGLGKTYKLVHKYQIHLCLGTREAPCLRCGGAGENVKRQALCPVCQNERWLLKIPEKIQ
jgi:hypothetical protein